MKTLGMVLLIFLIAVAVFVGSWLLANQAVPEDIIVKLDKAGIVLGLLLACLSVGLGTVAFIRRQDFAQHVRRWLRRSHFENVGEEFDGKVTAIVIPVSRHEQPEWIIRWLKPKHVAFLYTSLTQSKNAVLKLVERFGSQVTFFPNKEMVRKEELIIRDPDDPSESKTRTHHFLQHFLEQGIPQDEIFVDTTGGKVPMSIGAFQAAEELNVSTIYVVGRDNGYITKPDRREHGDARYISKRGTPS